MDRWKCSNNTKIDKRYVNSMISSLGMTVIHSKLPKTNLFIYMIVYVLQEREKKQYFDPHQASAVKVDVMASKRLHLLTPP